MKQREVVALVYGGDSSEHEVSVNSGKNVAKKIDRERFSVWEVLLRGKEWLVVAGDEELKEPIPIDKGDFSFLLPNGDEGQRVNFDKVLIMVHGTPGEDGLFQAYLEMIGLPFTSCSASVSMLTFDKYACKAYLRGMDIAMAEELFLRKGESYNLEEIKSKFELPLFVKPNMGGSSFGVTKVKKWEELERAIEYAFEEDEALLIEQFIEGREVTNGTYVGEGGELVSLPVTEIVTENEFFDYEAKYLGESEEICPAPIEREVSDNIVTLTHEIYRKLGCRGVVRVDYILDSDNRPYFLEINTIPGMTKMSLIPQQLATANISIKESITQILSLESPIFK